MQTIDTGWDFRIFIIDRAWVARIPRHMEAARALALELRVLPEIHERLPCPVPDYVATCGRPPRRVDAPAYRHHHGGSEAAPFFALYRYLPGRPPVKDEFTAELGAQVGAILRAVHDFPVERALELGVPGGDSASWRRDLERFLDRCSKDVLPRLDHELHVRARVEIEAFLEEDENFAFTPVLLHSDFGRPHILCRAGRVSGVLDWADVCLGDPALDYGWPLSMGGAFAAALEVPDDVVRRAAFYHALAPLHDVLYGLDTRRSALIQAGLHGIAERFSLGLREN